MAGLVPMKSLRSGGSSDDDNNNGDIGGVVAKLDSNHGYASIRVSSYPSLVLKKGHDSNWGGSLADYTHPVPSGCEMGAF